jgi:hypothetical protein
MYVERVPNRTSPPAILLREAWREAGRVRKRTVANLTDWPPARVEALRRVLRDEPLVRADELFTIETCRCRMAMSRRSWAWSGASGWTR